MSEFTFENRAAAGRALARAVAQLPQLTDAVVLALPRGGVPVAFEVAQALHAPLDVFLVRKLGVPGYEELAMGAIASGGAYVLNEPVLRSMRIEPRQLDEVVHREQQELDRRERVFRTGERIPLAGRTVVLVDDGLATGSTMRAAVQAVKQHGPRRIVVAVPVAASDTCQDFQALVDDLVCLYTPEPFIAVGRWYEDFEQLTDTDVRAILERAAQPLAH